MKIQALYSIGKEISRFATQVPLLGRVALCTGPLFAGLALFWAWSRQRSHKPVVPSPSHNPVQIDEVPLPSEEKKDQPLNHQQPSPPPHSAEILPLRTSEERLEESCPSDTVSYCEDLPGETYYTCEEEKYYTCEEKVPFPLHTLSGYMSEDEEDPPSTGNQIVSAPPLLHTGARITGCQTDEHFGALLSSIVSWEATAELLAEDSKGRKQFFGALSRLGALLFKRTGTPDGTWMEGSATKRTRQFQKALDNWEQALAKAGHVAKTGVLEALEMAQKHFAETLPALFVEVDLNEQEGADHQRSYTQAANELLKTEKPKSSTLIKGLGTAMGMPGRLGAITTCAKNLGLWVAIPQEIKKAHQKVDKLDNLNPDQKEALKALQTAQLNLASTVAGIMLDIVYDQGDTKPIQLVLEGVERLTKTQQRKYARVSAQAAAVTYLRSPEGQQGDLVKAVKGVESWYKNLFAARLREGKEESASEIFTHLADKLEETFQNN